MELNWSLKKFFIEPEECEITYTCEIKSKPDGADAPTDCVFFGFESDISSATYKIGKTGY